MQPCCRYVAGANDKECPERRAWNQTNFDVPSLHVESFPGRPELDLGRDPGKKQPSCAGKAKHAEPCRSLSVHAASHYITRILINAVLLVLSHIAEFQPF